MKRGKIGLWAGVYQSRRYVFQPGQGLAQPFDRKLKAHTGVWSARHVGVQLPSSFPNPEHSATLCNDVQKIITF